MLFNTAVVSTVALCMASQAMGAAVEIAAAKEARGLLVPRIASNSYLACNCPNNCDHEAGASCKYWVDDAHTRYNIASCKSDDGGPKYCNGPYLGA